jgi:hypothetical protein
MKKGQTLILKAAICLIAIVVLAWLIIFPQTEGRAKDLDLISIYSDPFILYFFIASTPFFLALFQAFKLLGYVDKNKIFTLAAIKAVRNIKYCALAIICFLVSAILFIRVMAPQGEDTAGPTMLGLIAIFISVVVATGAAVFQKLLQNAVDIKAENDLTV